MSETLSFTELEAQDVEFLPARTVLSLMLTTGGSKPPGSNTQTATNTSQGGNGGLAVAVNAGNINLGPGGQNNIAAASADGGNSHAGQFAWQNYHGAGVDNHQSAINTSHGGNGGIAVAVNAGNINLGPGVQNNVAVASANGGNSYSHQFVWQNYHK